MVNRQKIRSFMFAVALLLTVLTPPPARGETKCHLQMDGSCVENDDDDDPHQNDNSSSNDENVVVSSSSSSSSCGLYMAESAIPNSGLGMYTARYIKENERIFSGDVVLNIEDIEVNLQLWLKQQQWHNHHNNNNNNHSTNKKKFDDATTTTTAERWLLDQYFWNAANTLAMHEADDIQSILPGLGMLANSHTGLVNAVLKPPIRVAELHRGRDPGAGASTTFHDVHFVASRGPIEAGSELYVEYGDGWFEERSDLGMVPLSGDFRKADELLEKFERIIVDAKTENNNNNNNTTQLAENVWDLLLHAVSGEPRLKNALPRQLQDVHHVHRIGTANHSVPNRIRSPEWLEKNGICMDNIRPGMSTLRQAGWGAFATRNILKGHVIAPLPMVHMRRHQMEIYDTDDLENPNSNNNNNVWRVGTQQFLNYCYSHPESSLLLFPYAPVVNYVNHNNSTTFNAKLKWSTNPNHHADWLQLTPTELLRTKDHAGIIMEMVATRDIAVDEEIFLNYGAGWEQAWKEYVETKWKPDDEDKRYVSAVELDSQIQVLKTHDELEESPYGLGTVLTVCTIGNFDGGKVMKRQREKTTTTTTIYEWNSEPNMYNNSDHLHPCHVVKRDKATGANDFLYTVSIIPDDHDRPSSSGRDILVEHVPRSAIQFFDQPYTSDMFLRNSFRHEIWIPDEIFPAAWRDLKQ